jgi:FkbM family methyltransferase
MTLVGAAKSGLQRLLNRFGYHLSKLDKETAEYRRYLDVQGQLIRSEEPTVVCAGAGTGDECAAYRTLFPLASVHALEPDPDSFDLLSQRMLEDERVVCHEIAVSDEVGCSILHRNVDPASSSLLATDQTSASLVLDGLLRTVTDIEVKTTTIGALCETLGIQYVDILRIDAPGSEFAVLQGASSMLESGRIAVISVRLTTVPTYEGQRPLHEYMSLLESNGYGLLDGFLTRRSRGRLTRADILFVSPSMKRWRE